MAKSDPLTGILASKRPLPKLTLPPLAPSRPITIEFLPALTSHRGKLLSKSPLGTPVHAGGFLRQRRIVLETSLLRDRGELRRILVHELFHFVWMRLGNRRRGAWSALLSAELRAKVPGELGWSAEHRKDALRRSDRLRKSRRWREYICESFCDSAAWLYAELPAHEEFTLPRRARAARRRFFEGLAERPLAL